MTEALIIDDNRTTADALGQMLNVLGFKTRIAYGSGAVFSESIDSTRRGM